WMTWVLTHPRNLATRSTIDRCPLTRRNSNPGGPMNLPLVELFPTDPFLRIGGELPIFSQLQINDRFRVIYPTFLNSLE
ncbi:MAG: hypothetical protein EBY22_11860, partial [Gammaproteobacteria bacterium]|nr:hypothetical protein [Gammaproteobacteria bacterium]